MDISAVDRRILNCIQEDIPLVSAPFKVLSKHIGIEEEELLERIKKLKESGVIRTFGAGLSHRKLGFKGTLVALRVAPDEVEALASELSRYTQVTHCYLREGDYNLYFVLICKDEEEVQSFLNGLKEKVGEENIANLTTQKQFKLKTRFNL